MSKYKTYVGILAKIRGNTFATVRWIQNESGNGSVEFKDQNILCSFFTTDIFFKPQVLFNIVYMLTFVYNTTWKKIWNTFSRAVVIKILWLECLTRTFKLVEMFNPNI